MQTLHNFPSLPDSERLAYEFLTVENSSVLVDLFQQDNNPFIDERFKTLEGARQFALESENAKCSAKHGGCDFLIRLKNSQNYIGVLHLFDLSIESFAENDLKATIGFAIASPNYRQYFATEAVKHFIQYIQQSLKKTMILAYTPVENQAANDFLLAINLFPNNEDYIYGNRGLNYYELTKFP
jgi:RimJ/RimL family protein N-acetyltransferase